jgi:hypothetical protein
LSSAKNAVFRALEAVFRAKIAVAAKVQYIIIGDMLVNVKIACSMLPVFPLLCLKK